MLMKWSWFRTWSQGKFLLHEAVAFGCFNEGYCGASGPLQAWDSVLVNSKKVVHLLVDRLAGDFEALNPRMRRPYSAKDVKT